MAQFTARCYGSTFILVWPGGPTWTLVFLLLYNIASMIGTSGAIPGCVCPGDKLTYRCTIQESLFGATIWNGTAFNGCQQNEIILQHWHFTPIGGPIGTCNNGAIVGQSLGVQVNNYTSQLNVTITPETAGKTITCVYDDFTGQDIMIKFSTIIPGQLPPPNKFFISTANFVSRHLTFSWSPVAPDCPAICYNILASNCGSCPTTTNHTNVTCTDVPTENSVCTFAIQTVLCGSLIGNKSDPVIVHTETSQERNNADMSTNTACLATISSLVVVLITSVVVFTTAISIILQRSKAKIKKLQPSNRAEGSTQMESTYEEPTPSVSAINTRDNIAYGHTKITIT